MTVVDIVMHSRVSVCLCVCLCVFLVECVCACACVGCLVQCVSWQYGRSVGEIRTKSVDFVDPADAAYASQAWSGAACGII
jgi:hypothetical protein